MQFLIWLQFHLFRLRRATRKPRFSPPEDVLTFSCLPPGRRSDFAFSTNQDK
jgi:hypothetical protein